MSRFCKRGGYMSLEPSDMKVVGSTISFEAGRVGKVIQVTLGFICP